MKLPLSWLNDYVSVGISAEKLAERLTMAGLEVECTESFGNDTVFELEITPNRPDCLSIYGLAREAAAVLDKPLKKINIKKFRWPTRLADVRVEDAKDCSRYIGVVIKNVSIGSSSDWMQKRLSAIGTRSINNIVDVTNFCLMETGQPLHAFDLDKLAGGKVYVRRARQGEKIVTIDGIERQLDPSILVIADADRVVAIAGIMGGKDTEVTAATRNILLESANFDPILIRRASRKLGLSSDSSYRFERGIERENVASTSARAVALILDMAGGEITARRDVMSKVKRQKISIGVDVDVINDYLGASLSSARCQRILKQLGCVVSGTKNRLKVIPPVFRNDLKIKEDFVEEIARIIGYDRLPESLPVIKVSQIALDQRRIRRQQMRQTLLSVGLDEIVTYSMMSAEEVAKTKLSGQRGVLIQNPLSQEQEMLRPSALPSLLKVVRFNLNHHQKDLRFFELGKIYPTADERESLAIVMTGTQTRDWRGQKNSQIDFYDLKGTIEAVNKSLNIEKIDFVPTEFDYFEKGEAAKITINGRGVGECGKISTEVLRNWDIKRDVVLAAVVDLEEIYTVPSQAKAYQRIPEFPAVCRDVSLAAPREITFQQIESLMRREGGDILSDVQFIEEYLGEKIADGKRGLVISLRYQSTQRTLIEDEVNKVHESIVRALDRELGAVRR